MRVPLVCLVGSTLLVAGAAADLPDRGQITALSKTFLRDSAELPMDVHVKTVVTDAKGKTKRDAQSNVQFVFRGYSTRTEKYAFRSTAGFMSLRVLHDSIAGNFAAVNAFSRLTPHDSNPAEVTIEPGGPGGSFIIRSKAAADCHGFSMSAKFLYGEHYCYAAVFRVARDAAGKLAVQDFAVDIEQLPAPGKLRYLGEGQVRKIHSDGEVQEARMGDDPRPFLIPKRVTTTIETDKDAVVGDERLYTAHGNEEVRPARRGDPSRISFRSRRSVLGLWSDVIERLKRENWTVGRPGSHYSPGSRMPVHAKGDGRARSVLVDIRCEVE